MPSLVVLEAFHLANIPLLGDIVIPAIIVAIVMAIRPGGVMIVVVPMAIMVVAIPLVMLVPISTIMVVVVSFTVIASLVSRLLVFANMMLPLSVFGLLYLAL
jgi:hypothetical protein